MTCHAKAPRDPQRRLPQAVLLPRDDVLPILQLHVEGLSSHIYKAANSHSRYLKRNRDLDELASGDRDQVIRIVIMEP